MCPFYCPGDHKVYIDLSFYSDLKHRFKAPGDYAQAYVIAHEVGHHVQTLLGISEEVQQSKSGLSEADSNPLSVRMELQADCLAGVWAHHAHQSRLLLEEGDVEEGLAAASTIGDDRLQKQSQGYVSPDSFTYGSSAPRVKWFRIGLERGSAASRRRAMRIRPDPGGQSSKTRRSPETFFYARFRTDPAYFCVHSVIVSSGNLASRCGWL
jgi:predicted metalloprotease